jgi:hypothetical protein
MMCSAQHHCDRWVEVRAGICATRVRFVNVEYPAAAEPERPRCLTFEHRPPQRQFPYFGALFPFREPFGGHRLQPGTFHAAITLSIESHGQSTPAGVWWALTCNGLPGTVRRACAVCEQVGQMTMIHD